MEILFRAYFKVTRHAASKNEKKIRYNRRNGKSFIGKSDEAIAAEEWMLRVLQIEKIKKRIETITCDVNLKAIFYIPKTVFYTNKGERKKTLIDLSNGYELVQDCLQKTGIIENDTLICGHDGSRRMAIDGNEYYLEIELGKMCDDKES